MREGPHSMMSSREDGRDGGHLRPMECELRPLNHADGSARFVFKGTAVLAGVFGPREGRAAIKASDESVITVNWNRGDGLSGSREKEYETIVRNILEAVVVRSQDPLCVIEVSLQAVTESGGSLSAAINAAVVAVIDAGVAVEGLCAAVTVALMHDGSILLDPTSGEEGSARGVMTVTLRGHDHALLSSVVSGKVGEEELLTAIEAAGDAVSTVLTFIRMAVEKRLEKEQRCW